MMLKTELRKTAVDIRNQLDNDLISSVIVSNILSWDVFKQAKSVMLFYPIKSEINLLSLLSIENKDFYFPKIIENGIVPVFFDKNLGFFEGKYNISEPLGPILQDFSKLDLILLPALAASLSGYRLGYGKGFYDRFIKQVDKSNTATCVPISKTLLFDDLPVEEHDEKLDYLITESGVITSYNLDVLSP